MVRVSRPKKKVFLKVCNILGVTMISVTIVGELLLLNSYISVTE